MRIKHIVLPIVALAVLSAYGFHSEVQKSKFKSDVWKSAHYGDTQNGRANMLSPLMGHVLKVGMSSIDVESILGVPDEERRGGTLDIGAPTRVLVYNVEKENAVSETLVLEFSSNMKLTDFYILGRVRPLIF